MKGVSPPLYTPLKIRERGRGEKSIIRCELALRRRAKRANPADLRASPEKGAA